MVESEISEWFRHICSQNGLTISKDQLHYLEKYVELLLDWNRKLNLISRRDEGKVWERHVLHSASVLFHFLFSRGNRILDLGSGGGLPGIPIKILVPSLSLTMIDSVRKKTVAVSEIVRDLSLSGVDVAWGRAEELGKKNEFRCQFDHVIARGVGNLRDLVRWSLPFLDKERSSAEFHREEGERIVVPPRTLIAMKGGDVRVEIAAAQRDKRVKSIFVQDLGIEGLEPTENPDRKAIVVLFN